MTKAYLLSTCMLYNGRQAGLRMVAGQCAASPITFHMNTKDRRLLVLLFIAQLVHQVAMDLPLPDFKSLPGQQIYYLYGFAALLLLLLLAVFRALSGPSKQAGAARKIKGTSNVLFVGPMASGKTSLFGRVGPLSLFTPLRSAFADMQSGHLSSCIGLLHRLIPH